MIFSLIPKEEKGLAGILEPSCSEEFPCDNEIAAPSLLHIKLRPDQFNLLLLGYCEVKIGLSDRKKRKKAINWGVVIDHNLIKTD